jgi:hypothetical protein
MGKTAVDAQIWQFDKNAEISKSENKKFATKKIDLD